MRGAFIVFVILSMSFVSADLSRDYLCNKTYEGKMNNQTSQELLEEIMEEKGIITSKDVLNYYQDEWEDLCSFMNISLSEEYLCQRIYYFILSNNYNYTDEEFSNLANQTNSSVDIVENYLINNWDFCSSKGYSETLPQKELPKLYISNKEVCDTEMFYESSIPIFTSISLDSCKKVEFWKYFFKIEEFSGYYSITGIKVYLFPTGLVFFMFLWFFLSDRFYRKVINRKN